MVYSLGRGIDLIVVLAARKACQLSYIFVEPKCRLWKKHTTALEFCRLSIQTQGLVRSRRRSIRFDSQYSLGLEILDQLRTGGFVLDENDIRIMKVKVDRLTRSLTDFAKIIEIFDSHSISFVSVTQQFNTISSMGRLTLNVLLSFAQFEREITGERIRDKIAASKKKGIWMGGMVPLGYNCLKRKILVCGPEADTVRHPPAIMEADFLPERSTVAGSGPLQIPGSVHARGSRVRFPSPKVE
jgi:hypothetical protein